MGDSNDASSGKRKRSRKPMKDRSEVWDHFTKFVDAKGAQRARCNYCEKVYCSEIVLMALVHLEIISKLAIN